jgi:hypothetical protein
VCAAQATIKASFAANLPADRFGRSNLYGAAVRLAFHDAGEYDRNAPLSDTYGPDGCLSMHPSNAGLIEPTSLVNSVMEPLWQSVCDQISRADFWVLYGKMVVETAASAPVSVNYQFGRKDNVVCNDGGGRLPSAEGDLTEIGRVFLTQMGLTLNDAGTLCFILFYFSSASKAPNLTVSMFLL